VRLSLETIALLPAVDAAELKVIEDIFDYHMFDMMFSDVRLASYYNARLDRIQLLPLSGALISSAKSPKEDIMTTKKEIETKTEKKNGLGQKVVDVINVLAPTLTAIKSWIKATSKWSKS
jgi:hypothetical protein